TTLTGCIALSRGVHHSMFSTSTINSRRLPGQPWHPRNLAYVEPGAYHSGQWLQNRATNEIHLADAKKAGSLESIGAVDFNRIEIRLRVWSCYSDASARLTADNIEVLLGSTGQVIASDDMEGSVLQRWEQWEWSRGGDLMAVISPDDQSHALQMYVPNGVNASCAGVWAVRTFNLPFTVNTSNVDLRLFIGAEGSGNYHEGFFEVRLYKAS
ncbi:MAG: hypothetical protein NTX23_07000, partial [Candidatus Bipolaricaulota bacterium]|nr:hypothetical protein [Candidatus Bipolaricaulota bacterium]